MAVLGILSFTLEVPDLEDGLRFYIDAGLIAATEGASARLRCTGQDRECIILLGGFAQKRLHHITLRADELTEIAKKTPAMGGKVVKAPEGFEQDGLWVTDPHGMLIHLRETAADSELSESPAFEINAPGRIVRRRRSAILPAKGATTPNITGRAMCSSPARAVPNPSPRVR